MLKLKQRHNGANWYIRGTVRGQSVDESTGTSDRRIAEEIRIKREAELLEQSVHGRRVTMLFSQAALSYLEHGGDTRFMKPLLLHLGSTKLSAIGQSELDRAGKLLYPGCAPSTLNRQLYTPISAVMQHAAKRGWCDVTKYDRPKEPPGRVRWITKAEAEVLLRACAPHLRPLVMFLLYTGARVGEALWLDWKHISLERAHVSFHATKNGSSRGVPLHPLVVSELSSVTVRTGEVFRRPDGRPYSPLAEQDTSDTSAGGRIKKAFAGAVERAGLRDFRPHDCRHTWATWHYQANKDLGALQALGGWRTLSMVMRYAHTNVDEHAATIGRL